MCLRGTTVGYYEEVTVFNCLEYMLNTLWHAASIVNSLYIEHRGFARVFF